MVVGRDGAGASETATDDEWTRAEGMVMDDGETMAGETAVGDGSDADVAAAVGEGAERGGDET